MAQADSLHALGQFCLTDDKRNQSGTQFDDGMAEGSRQAVAVTAGAGLGIGSASGGQDYGGRAMLLLLRPDADCLPLFNPYGGHRGAGQCPDTAVRYVLFQGSDNIAGIARGGENPPVRFGFSLHAIAAQERQQVMRGRNGETQGKETVRWGRTWG